MSLADFPKILHNQLDLRNIYCTWNDHFRGLKLKLCNTFPSGSLANTCPSPPAISSAGHGLDEAATSPNLGAAVAAGGDPQTDGNIQVFLRQNNTFGKQESLSQVESD